jgi:hypothetical protein
VLAFRYAAVFAVWAGLFLGVCALLGLVGVVAWLQARRRDLLGPAPSPMQTRPSPTYYARLAHEAGELTREAAVAAVAAERAVAAEAAARDRLAVAQQAREAAWQAYEQARRDAAEVQRRGPVVAAPAVPEDEVLHDVSRAALAAYRRGDLSVDQLHEVYRQASGSNPAQEQHEHDLVRRRAAEHGSLLAYRAAATVEQAARESAEVATVAAQALVEEAGQAAADAEAARQVAADCARRLHPLRRKRT